MSSLDQKAVRKLRRRLQAGPLDVSRDQVVQLVLAWVHDKTPAAVVRFGEGEGRLLIADPADPESMTVAANKLKRQTGRKYDASEVLAVKSLVANAFDEADVLGIRGSASFQDEHKMWVERIEQAFESRVAAGRRPAYVSHCLLNNHLRDALPELLKDQEQVSIISCRDLGPRIHTEHGVRDVKVYQVPSQYIVRAVDDEYEAALHGVPMWPDFYHRLREEITVRRPGEIFLIGAGLFGKDLCIRVRELGGIALDLGSCLDGLADKVTRGPKKPPPYRP